jgi:hypothetical protein
MFERTHQPARARAALAGREGGRPDLMVTDVEPERVASPRRLKTFRGELDLAILPSRSGGDRRSSPRCCHSPARSG